AGGISRAGGSAQHALQPTHPGPPRGEGEGAGDWRLRQNPICDRPRGWRFRKLPIVVYERSNSLLTLSREAPISRGDLRCTTNFEAAISRISCRYLGVRYLWHCGMTL